VRTPEPLFPRYLFIWLDGAVNWMPIRSTLGVTSLVRFGAEPARVPESVVQAIEDGERATMASASAPRALSAGDAVAIVEGPFAGLRAVYDMPEGEQRAFVFIEMLSKAVRLAMDVSAQPASEA
jgi:transcriptional antiterminator RfaH